MPQMNGRPQMNGLISGLVEESRHWQVPSYGDRHGNLNLNINLKFNLKLLLTRPRPGPPAGTELRPVTVGGSNLATL